MPFKLRSPLKPFAKKVHSQNDEDGIIEAIFEDIPARSRYFVEFGIGPNWLDTNYSHGLEGNCVLLRNKGWKGILMDGGVHPAEYEVHQEFITALNINSLLRKYQVPEDVDIISIDVDGQDFWIWLALDYRPSLIIIEQNPNFTSLQDSCTVGFDPNFRWDVTKYFGASLGALIKLGAEKITNWCMQTDAMPFSFAWTCSQIPRISRTKTSLSPRICSQPIILRGSGLRSRV